MPARAVNRALRFCAGVCVCVLYFCVLIEVTQKKDTRNPSSLQVITRSIPLDPGTCSPTHLPAVCSVSGSIKDAILVPTPNGEMNIDTPHLN